MGHEKALPGSCSEPCPIVGCSRFRCRSLSAPDRLGIELSVERVGVGLVADRSSADAQPCRDFGLAELLLQIVAQQYSLPPPMHGRLHGRSHSEQRARVCKIRPPDLCKFRTPLTARNLICANSACRRRRRSRLWDDPERLRSACPNGLSSFSAVCSVMTGWISSRSEFMVVRRDSGSSSMSRSREGNDLPVATFTPALRAMSAFIWPAQQPPARVVHWPYRATRGPVSAIDARLTRRLALHPR